MVFCGIDPGATGAIGIIEVTAANQIVAVRVFDTPTIRLKVGKSLRTRPDMPALRDLLMREVMVFGGAYALLEGIQPQPKFGASAMFWMGYSRGVWEMALSCLSIPYAVMRSQDWKKKVGIVGDDRTKGNAREMAARMFPQIHKDLARKKDDGRAEAVLIAEVARRTYTGGAPLEQPHDLFSGVSA